MPVQEADDILCLEQERQERRPLGTRLLSEAVCGTSARRTGGVFTSCRLSSCSTTAATLMPPVLGCRRGCRCPHVLLLDVHDGITINFRNKTNGRCSSQRWFLEPQFHRLLMGVCILISALRML